MLGNRPRGVNPACREVSSGNRNENGGSLFPAESGAVGDVPVKLTYTQNGQNATATKNITVQKPTSLSIVPGSSSTTSEGPCTTSQGLPGCGVRRTFVYQVQDQFALAVQFGGMPFWDSVVALALPTGCTRPRRTYAQSSNELPFRRNPVRASDA